MKIKFKAQVNPSATVLAVVDCFAGRNRLR